MIQENQQISRISIRQIIVLFLIFIISPSSFSQNINQQNKEIKDKLSSSFQNKTEIIYLQTNKGIYETGEDLWFKAYILDAQYFFPSDYSKTLYLQLINEKNRQICWQEKYEIKNRFATGHVFINDTLSEGNYLLQAFTSHSFFNDGSEFESSRRVVVKKDMKPRVTIKTEFSRTSFSKGDTISLNIIALNEKSKPLYSEIIAELGYNDKVLEKIKAVTNSDGKAKLVFGTEHTQNGLTVNIKTKYSDTFKQQTISVPFHTGNLIQFSMFPEGGDLVSNLQNTLAFKTVNINGDPLETEGILFENGDTLLRFKSTHAGMGSFDFMPDANKKYHIKLSKPYSDSLWVLPEIKQEGITFHLTKRDSNFIVFKVRQNAGLNEKVICLRGQMRGNVYCFLSGVLTEELEVKVDQREFPQQGIAEFTLLNGDLLPLAERLVYVNTHYKLHIETKLSKKKYSTREKVKLEIEVKDKYGRPVVAHLGISIFDKIYQNHQDAKNIFTHYYLSTQIKGRIYDPAYYFNKKNKNRTEALDLLLLTQGWRRYVWSENLLAENAKNLSPILFDGVKGEVKATKKIKKAPKGNQAMSIYNPAKDEKKYLLLADSKGNFEVTPVHLDLGRGGFIYFKPNGKDIYSYKLLLKPPFDIISEILSLKKSIYPTQCKTIKKEVQTRSFVPGLNVIELDEILIEADKKTQFRNKYIGYLDSIAKFSQCSDYVAFCGRLNCPFHTDPIVHKHRKPIEGEELGVYIIYDLNSLTFKNSDLVRIIYHYPKITEEELMRMNNLSRVKGYYIEREFYKPNYDKQDSLVTVPDYRNTLYWNPLVLTNREGKATIEFFCSDIYTGFIGVIEGVSGDGMLGAEQFEFKVLKTN